MNKRILLMEKGLVLIRGKELFAVYNEEDNLKIDEYDFFENAKSFKIFNGFLLYELNGSLYKFDLSDGKSTVVFDLNDRNFAVDSGRLYCVSFKDGNVVIEIFDENFKKTEEYKFLEFEEVSAYFDEEYPIMVNLWEDDEEYSVIRTSVTGFAVEDNLFVFSVNKNLYFGDFDKDIVKYIEIPQTFGMNVELFLRKPALTLHGKDKELSFDFTVNQLPFRRKRRGGIEKLEIKLLKRGIDDITPSVSGNGEYWFGAEGEHELYPIIINLKRMIPLVVFDEPVTKNHAMAASEDFKSFYITDFDNELKKYEWNKEGIFLDYIVDLKE